MTAAELREKYIRSEIDRIAEAMYEQDVKPKVEPEHKGEWLILDVLTGEYVTDEDEVEVAMRALERFPEGVRFIFHIGYPASGRLGFRFKEAKMSNTIDARSLTGNEVSRIAHEIYDRDIKPKVEPQHKGEWLVMDILTGEYLIDADDIQVSIRAMEKFPNGVRFGMRIGYPYSGRI